MCHRDVKFVCILHGWKGSTADGMVFFDAVIQNNTLKVLKGIFIHCVKVSSNHVSKLCVTFFCCDLIAFRELLLVW